MTTKLAIKYGMIIAIGVMAWVIVTHVLVPNLNSPIHSIGTVTFFNVLQFVSIFLGLKELERIRKTKVSFKEGIKTGVAISLVYAIAASLFFSGALLLIGPQFMTGDQMAAPQSPMWKVASALVISLPLLLCRSASSCQGRERRHAAVVVTVLTAEACS